MNSLFVGGFIKNREMFLAGDRPPTPDRCRVAAQPTPAVSVSPAGDRTRRAVAPGPQHCSGPRVKIQQTVVLSWRRSGRGVTGLQLAQLPPCTTRHVSTATNISCISCLSRLEWVAGILIGIIKLVYWCEALQWPN